MYKDEENFIHLYFFNGLTDDNIPIYKDIDLSSIPFSYTCIENGMYCKDYKFDNKSIIKINCTLVANNNSNSIEYKELKLKKFSTIKSLLHKGFLRFSTILCGKVN